MHAPTQVYINLLHSINSGETLAALETDICIQESGSCATLQRRFWSMLQMRAVGRLVLNPAEQRVAHRRLWETPAKAVAEDPRRNSIKNSVVIILCAASAHRKRRALANDVYLCGGVSAKSRKVLERFCLRERRIPTNWPQIV